jgi:HlyD family secretion protein
MMTKRRWLILAGVVVATGSFVTLGLNRSSQAQHFAAKVERGEIKDVVEATGTINSVITVQVGSQVSGTIRAWEMRWPPSRYNVQPPMSLTRPDV